MRSLILVCALLFIVFSGFTGCASKATKIAMSDPGLTKIEPQAKMLEVPFTEQSNEYCGPTALKMVLDDRGEDVGLDLLTTYTYSPNVKGSTKADMLGAVRRLGLVPLKINRLPELLREVSRGRSVVVFYNSALSFDPLWHFGVLTGYDLEARKVYLHTGDTPNRLMNLEFFYDRWLEGDLWAMTIVDPKQIPKSASFDELFENLQVFVNLGSARAAKSLLKEMTHLYPDRNELDPYIEALL